MQWITRGWSLIASAAFVLATASPANAQKTDVVSLANGDRVTGEVKNLDRGRLELSTDDIGTIFLEWDNVVSLVSKYLFEVGMSDGRRFLGSFGPAESRSLAVVGEVSTDNLLMSDVTMIRPIGAGFWKKLDGSVDVGFSYTRSSAIAQLNVNSTTVYRRPAFEARFAASGTFTATETDNPDDGDDGRDDRATLQASYSRFRGRRAYLGGAAGFESNDSLGLLLRSQISAFGGARWVNSNSAQLLTGIGLAVNDERAIDAEATQNLELVLSLRSLYFSYDRPRTNFDAAMQYYPSLSDWGRQRIQLDSSVKREIWKDVFLTVNVFDSFDSRPPNVDAQRNDVGVVLAFGWTY